MLQNTTHVKQMMGGSDAPRDTLPYNDTGSVDIYTRDENAVEEWMPGQEEILADDTRGDHSTVSTDWSRDKRAISTFPSPLLEAETDPTSMPSGALDDFDLERKSTKSPLDSIEAVYGSDSVHSEQSDPSTADTNSRQGVSIAVNAGKVKAVGDHLSESITKVSTQRFHDPDNSWEAKLIKDKIEQTNGNSVYLTV